MAEVSQWRTTRPAGQSQNCRCRLRMYSRRPSDGRRILVQGSGRHCGYNNRIIPLMNAFGWIAIVDDDPSVLKALKRLFRVRGIQAKTYATAEEFLAALPDGLPECLIIDLQLPDMTGLEVLQYLKHKGFEVSAIVITAHGDSGAR